MSAYAITAANESGNEILFSDEFNDALLGRTVKRELERHGSINIAPSEDDPWAATAESEGNGGSAMCEGHGGRGQRI